MSSEKTILKKIENVILVLLKSFKEEGNIPFISLPSRYSRNQNYVRIELVKHIRKFTSSILLLKIIMDLILSGKHATKRDIYYLNILIFGSQKMVDQLLDDFACLFNVSRRHLHITASSRGMIGGNIEFYESKIKYDCTKTLRMTGKSISPHIDDIHKIRTNARFLLVVEGESTFTRLMEDSFCWKNNCIIVTGKGYPDLATRLMINKISREFPNIKVFSLTDSDPHGIEICHIYQHGSKAMGHQNAELATPKIKRIGIDLSDFKKFDIPSECLLELSENDIKKCRSLLKLPPLKDNDESEEEEGESEEEEEEEEEKKKSILEESLQLELRTMIEKKVKAEIQALCSKSIVFLSEEYLPKKINLLL